MKTPSRTRDNRRNRARCARVAANWFLDGRNQISTQTSTLSRSWFPPAKLRLKRTLHQLLEFLSRSRQLGLYGSGLYTQNRCGFADGKAVHIAELEGPEQSGRKLRHQLPHAPSQFTISILLLRVRSRACQPL